MYSKYFTISCKLEYFEYSMKSMQVARLRVWGEWSRMKLYGIPVQPMAVFS